MVKLTVLGRQALAVTAGVTLAVSLSACAQESEKPQRDSNGAVTKALNNADVFDLRVGDCLNVNSGAKGSVHAVQVTPCAESHTAEVYGVVDAAKDASYPGAEKLVEEGTKACKDQFKGFIGKAYDDSELELWPMVPTEKSWKKDDRKTLCIVSNPGESVNETMKGKNL